MDTFLDKINKNEFNFDVKRKISGQFKVKYLENLFIDRAKDFKEDLLLNEPRTILIPAPQQKHSGHKIRVVDSYAPKWYIELNNTYGCEFNSRSRTTNRVKTYRSSNYQRCRALDSFERIILGKDLNEKKSSYDKINRELIFEDLTNEENSYFGFNPTFYYYFFKAKFEKYNDIPF